MLWNVLIKLAIPDVSMQLPMLVFMLHSCNLIARKQPLEIRRWHHPCLTSMPFLVGGNWAIQTFPTKSQSG